MIPMRGTRATSAIFTYGFGRSRRYFDRHRPLEMFLGMSVMLRIVTLFFRGLTDLSIVATPPVGYGPQALYASALTVTGPS